LSRCAEAQKNDQLVTLLSRWPLLNGRVLFFEHGSVDLEVLLRQDEVEGEGIQNIVSFHILSQSELLLCQTIHSINQPKFAKNRTAREHILTIS
jgi:hypothetical protein